MEQKDVYWKNISSYPIQTLFACQTHHYFISGLFLNKHKYRDEFVNIPKYRGLITI